jgi:hypothetical protein
MFCRKGTEEKRLNQEETLGEEKEQKQWESILERKGRAKKQKKGKAF